MTRPASRLFDVDPELRARQVEWVETILRDLPQAPTGECADCKNQRPLRRYRVIEVCIDCARRRLVAGTVALTRDELVEHIAALKGKP